MAISSSIFSFCIGKFKGHGEFGSGGDALFQVAFVIGIPSSANDNDMNGDISPVWLRHTFWPGLLRIRGNGAIFSIGDHDHPFVAFNPPFLLELADIIGGALKGEGMADGRAQTTRCSGVVLFRDWIFCFRGVKGRSPF